eukprot:CAMPEP_0172532948 /NCGR_PEP_ID=MMETSP1067-20121228/5813_1 /TAXON_ID=265564 ORGANISM="Thalassiosira punctigera, Strain Tpunct2005C2" /NCGR_SAMPLE_ID=MMETSP1067 /ASSEMBLY_ACC=CAM_ASM_000444 /LENGTH=141 /DNA_ID=CAMNT_0013317519 /DNA_START=114 /DNA_END=536 /DNA_ORIENTATION=-
MYLSPSLGGSVKAEDTAWTVRPNSSRSVSTGGASSASGPALPPPFQALTGGGQRGSDILYERNVREAAVPSEERREERAEELRSRRRRAEEGWSPAPPVAEAAALTTLGAKTLALLMLATLCADENRRFPPVDDAALAAPL